MAGARDDIEALGGGAMVEFLEGFGGLRAESGKGVSLLGVFLAGLRRGGGDVEVYG